MQNFAIELSFSVAPILGKRLLGDSLIAGVLTQMCDGDWEKALAMLPIATCDGVPQMSEALLGYPFRSAMNQTVMISSPMRDIAHDPNISVVLNKMPPKSALTAARGDYKSEMNAYSWLDIDKLFFLGRGDIDALRRILRQLRFVGSQRNRGHGQVDRIDIWPIESDNPRFGIIGDINDRAHVLRPIPVRLRETFDPDGTIAYMLASETWHCPYLPTLSTSVVETCMVPDFRRGIYFTPDQIESGLTQAA
jgi:hypothetical protein